MNDFHGCWNLDCCVYEVYLKAPGIHNFNSHTLNYTWEDDRPQSIILAVTAKCCLQICKSCVSTNIDKRCSHKTTTFLPKLIIILEMYHLNVSQWRHSPCFLLNWRVIGGLNCRCSGTSPSCGAAGGEDDFSHWNALKVELMLTFI